MRILQYLILLIILVMSPVRVFATPEWINMTLSALAAFFSSCLEVPKYVNFNQGSKTLNISDSGKWIPTGSYVQGGKMIKFDWRTLGIEARPRKYKVMYRIDPRFTNPQLFIQEYNYAIGKYVSDFHKFNNGKLAEYQNNPDMVFSNRVKDYNNYFNFIGRNKISVYTGDVVNITLIDMGQFIDNSDKFNDELDYYTKQLTIAYTKTSGIDNGIVYSTIPAWCGFLGNGNNSIVCSTVYKNNSNSFAMLIGQPIESLLSNVMNNKICDESANIPTTDFCVYNKGKGMIISIGDQVIKNINTSFIHSQFNNKDFLYYRSEVSGDLNFTTSWKISNMFVNANQFMSNWGNYQNEDALKANIIDISSLYVHFGRYIMLIELGSGDSNISFEEQAAIKVEYSITDGSIPVHGDTVDYSMRVNANVAGYLWLRVINPNDEVQGAITVNYANYTGTTWFSDIIYNSIVNPIRLKFNEITRLFYQNLTYNASLHKIALAMLTIYVIIYGMFFLLGAVQITVDDLVYRIIKITLVVTMFSENSWNFFNQYLFSAVLNGTDYLMRSVTDMSGSVDNIFGFVDPIFDRYTNPRVWGLLFLQLLQIHNGLAFFAIMVMYSLILYFRAVIEVIVNYILAFVGLSVMISLAPIFLTFILFKQTRSLFDNWISTLVNYMLQPTILLIFFLLIDQIIATQLTRTITHACWDCLIPIKITIDLNHIGIPWSFSFALPFLPCIPFFVTKVAEVRDVTQLFGVDGTFMRIITSSLLFYAYSLMSYGLVEYITLLVSQLTNVTPARQEGNMQSPGNPTESIMHDMKSAISPVTNLLQKPVDLIKDKVIDGKYRANIKNTNSKNDSFADKIKEFRNDGELESTKESNINSNENNLDSTLHKKNDK